MDCEFITTGELAEKCYPVQVGYISVTSLTTTPISTLDLHLLTSLRYDPLLLTRSWNTWPGNPPSPFFLLPFHLERLINGARDFDWPKALEVLCGTGSDVPQLEQFRSFCQACVDRYFAEHPGSDADHPLKVRCYFPFIQPTNHTYTYTSVRQIRITLSPTGTLHADASPTPRRPYDLLAASRFDPSPLNAVTINNSTLDLSTLPPFATPPLRVLLDTQPTPSSILTSHKTTVRPHYDAARARASIPAPSASSASPPAEVLLYTPGAALISEGSIRNVAFYRENRWTTPSLSTGCLPGVVRRLLVESGRVVEGAVPLNAVRVGEWVMLCNGVEGCVLGVVLGDSEGAREDT